jgi:enoyl-CoA hydratase
MIHRERYGRVAVLKLEHGKVQALDLELCAALEENFEAAAEWDDTDAIVLTGAGSSFSAGVDLKRVLDGGPAYIEGFLAAMDRAFAALFRCPKPVVAALNGHAIAGGCVMACAADYRVMAQGKGRIGVPELGVGVSFPWLALEIVRLSTPVEHLQELLYLGETYDADQALARGLVDEAVAADKVQERGLAVATRLAGMSPGAFALTKRQLRLDSLAEWKRHQVSHDSLVRMQWTSADTLDRIRRYLDANVGKKG